jgi:hypothetical protein
MNINTILIISLAVALLGIILGGSMVVTQKRQTPTARPTRSKADNNRTRPSRKQLFVPMISLLGLSIFLIVIGYKSLNIISFAVGYVFLFFAFGLLGSFLFNKLF